MDIAGLGSGSVGAQSGTRIVRASSERAGLPAICTSSLSHCCKTETGAEKIDGNW